MGGTCQITHRRATFRLDIKLAATLFPTQIEITARLRRLLTSLTSAISVRTTRDGAWIGTRQLVTADRRADFGAHAAPWLPTRTVIARQDRQAHKARRLAMLTEARVHAYQTVRKMLKSAAPSQVWWASLATRRTATRRRARAIQARMCLTYAQMAIVARARREAI